MEEVLKYLGLKKGEIKVYYSLLKKKWVGVREIAKLTNLSERRVRSIIKNLLSKGFIVRKIKEDKRLKYVYSSVPIKQVWKKIKTKIESLLE